MTKARASGRARFPAFWAVAGVLFLVAINFLRDPGFLALRLVDGHLFGAPVDVLVEGSRIMVVALGMTLVIATGGIDLSVGSVVAVAGAVSALLITQGVHSLPLIVGAALATGLLAGALNGFLVAYVGVQPIVATLILMVAGRGVAQLVTGGQVLLLQLPHFEFLGNGFVGGLPFAGFVVGGFYLAAHLLLSRTAGRLFVEAVGDNPVASRLAGIPTARVTLLAYAFCGLCAGVAGALAAANIRAADPYRAGENMELDAIFAVVVGGTALTGGRFSLLGSLAGALLLQTLTITMYNVGISPAVATVPKAGLILLVCVIQSGPVRRWSAGIFRRRVSA